MKNFKQTLVLALGALIVLIPTNALAQSSGVEIWSQRCGMCHNQQPADRYSADKWESIMTHMTLNARLTSAQAEKVLTFLKSGARQVAVQESKGSRELTVASLNNDFLPEQTNGEEVYATNCVPCHGASGKGDGPAAVAFDPPPSNLTDAEVTKNRSIDDLVKAIATGNGGMPAFGAVLSTEEIEAVSGYIQSFRGFGSILWRHVSQGSKPVVDDGRGGAARVGTPSFHVFLQVLHRETLGSGPENKYP